MEYLRELGALEEREVLMPNYILGPSNCDGTTSFYDLCCPNACEVHKGHLERSLMGHMGEQVAKTRQVMAERLGSELRPELVRDLEQMAKEMAAKRRI